MKRVWRIGNNLHIKLKGKIYGNQKHYNSCRNGECIVF